MSKIEKITPQIAALYLGAKCDVDWLAPYNDDVWDAIEIDHSVIEKLSIAHVSITPHLRRLESITEQEAKELFFQYCGKRYEDVYTDDDALRCWWNMHEEWNYFLGTLAIGEPSVWLWLLSKGFDLFGLIEAGLAKEIKPETVNS